MKKTIFTILSLLFLLALDAPAQNSLVLNLSDGSTAVFSLAEQPQITFEGENLKVVAKQANIELPRAEVKTIKFENNDATGIEESSAESTSVTAYGNTVTITGVADGIAVRVFNTAGQVVLSTTANHGSCSLSLDGLANGLYIINYNNTTIKYIKK